MHSSVKNFLQQNKEYLITDDYDALIYNWYWTGTRYYWDDLVDTFNKAGIDFLSITEELRKKFIAKMIEQIIIANGKARIRQTYISTSLNDFLGLHVSEITQMTHEIAKKFGVQIF